MNRGTLRNVSAEALFELRGLEIVKNTFTIMNFGLK